MESDNWLIKLVIIACVDVQNPISHARAHTHKHNDAVESKGYCPICRRAQSPYVETPAVRS